jgi:hypothetical protein
MKVVFAPQGELRRMLLENFPNIKFVQESIDRKALLQNMIQPCPESSESLKTTAVTIIGELAVPFFFLPSVSMRRPIALKVLQGGFYECDKGHKFENLTVDEVVNPASPFIILARFAESQ